MLFNFQYAEIFPGAFWLLIFHSVAILNVHCLVVVLGFEVGFIVQSMVCVAGQCMLSWEEGGQCCWAAVPWVTVCPGWWPAVSAALSRGFARACSLRLLKAACRWLQRVVLGVRWSLLLGTLSGCPCRCRSVRVYPGPGLRVKLSEKISKKKRMAEETSAHHRVGL